MEEKLEFVRSLVLKPVDDGNFNAAIEATVFMIDKIPLMVTSLQPTIIARARPNDHTLFSKQTDISYNSTNTDKVEAGRFNRPAEGLFYGSLRVDNPDNNNVLSCILESCKELTDEKNPLALKDFTVGLWGVNETFPVINLCMDEKHLSGNQILRQAVEGYKNELRLHYTPQVADFILKFNTLFSELSTSSTKTGSPYYVSTAFFTAVRYYYGEIRNTAIPGIIYPGAMSEAKGLNIVLVTQAVDRFLTLEKVVMYRFVLVRGSKQYIGEPCSNAVSVSNGSFEITGYRLPGERIG